MTRILKLIQKLLYLSNTKFLQLIYKETCGSYIGEFPLTISSNGSLRVKILVKVPQPPDKLFTRLNYKLKINLVTKNNNNYNNLKKQMFYARTIIICTSQR